MAYDPNDPADKKIVKGLIDAALAEAAEEHDADVQGLKTKNKELLRKLKEAETGNGGGDNSAEVERLEGELRESKKALKAAEKARDDAAAERDEARTTAEKAVKQSNSDFVDTALTTALGGVKVSDKLLPGAKAMLQGKVEVKEVGGERKAFVGGKALGDFVTEWSQGDEGKHYVTAPFNGGGGGGKPPTTPQGGTKDKLSEMTLAEKTALAKEDPQRFNELLNAQKQAQRAARSVI